MDRLDLHGLNVEEALSKTEGQIDWLIKKGTDGLVILHGKGYHSEHRVGVIKQKIRSYLKEIGDRLKMHGYLVIYGESDFPIALEYDAGCTLIVKKGMENEYQGGRKQAAKNHIIYSEEGREMRKQQKRQRHRK